MDYESMSARELQDECARRGLPSGRAAKAAMVRRLTEHDQAEADEDADGDFADAPGVEVEAAPDVDLLRDVVVREVTTVDAPPVLVPSDGPDPLPDPEPGAERPVPAAVFQQTFPATPDGPSEDQHAAHRRDTRQAAVDAGLMPRGDARRVGTVDGQWVYEVGIRRPS